MGHQPTVAHRGNWPMVSPMVVSPVAMRFNRLLGNKNKRKKGKRKGRGAKERRKESKKIGEVGRETSDRLGVLMWLFLGLGKNGEKNNKNKRS